MSTPEIRLALYIGVFFGIGAVLLSIALTRSRSKKSRKPEDLPVPDEQYDTLTSHIDNMRHDSPSLGVPPMAASNVMRITEDCLFVRTAYGRMFGGHNSTSWGALALFMAMFFISLSMAYLDNIFTFFHGNGSFFEIFIFENYHLQYIIPFFFVVLLFPIPFYIPWRRQLPIIFNRKTRKVTCHISGKTRTSDWEKITARIRSLYSTSSPKHDKVLGIIMGDENEKELWIAVYQTDSVEAQMKYSNNERAAMIWEYIRLYMEKGPAALPPFVNLDESFHPVLHPILHPILEYGFDHVREVCAIYSIKWLFRTRWYWLPIAIPWVIVTLPFRASTFLAELIYMGLDRVLPRRRWPKELLEACDYVWDGSNDRGPISEHAKKAYPHHPVMG